MDTSDHGLSTSTISAWTLIVRAKGTGPEASGALGKLLHQYRGFIVWYMGTLRPPPNESTDDLYQRYVEGIVRRKDVEKLEKNGSLRGWLKTSVKNFLYNAWDDWRRQQRYVLREFDAFRAGTVVDIDAAYVASIIVQALELAESRSPNPARFAKLKRFLPGPQSDPAAQGPLAEQLGMKRVTLTHAIREERLRYQRCFDELVLATIDLGDDALDPVRTKQRLDAEKRELLAFLQEPPEGVVLEPAGDSD
jgi:DNA-directed RNA polymerase specialized sigma24 family protein